MQEQLFLLAATAFAQPRAGSNPSRAAAGLSVLKARSSSDLIVETPEGVEKLFQNSNCHPCRMQPAARLIPLTDGTQTEL